MRILGALVLATFLLVAPAPAAAQEVPFSGMDLTVGAVSGTVQEDGDDRLPYKGEGTVPVTVSLGCIDIFQALPDPTVDVTMDQPTWMSVTPAQLTFSPDLCGDPAASGFASVSGTVKFALKAEAPGVVPQTLNVTATFGERTDSAPVTFAVAYHSEYTVVPDAQFPLQARGNEASFNITVTQKSNARSMVMFEEVRTDRGTVSGLASVPYDNPPASKTFKVTYKGPKDGSWTEAKVDFVTKGHYLLPDGTSGELIDPKPTTWTFVNADPATSQTQESPLNGWVLVVAVLGAAFVAARRGA